MNTSFCSMWQRWSFLSFLDCPYTIFFLIFMSSLISFTDSSISVHTLKCRYFPGFCSWLSFLIVSGWVYPFLGNVSSICICSLVLSPELQRPLCDSSSSLGVRLWAKFSTLPAFIYKVLLERTTPIYLHILSMVGVLI